MPRLAKDVYAAQNQIVLDLAARPDGVCRNEIMKAIECSRPRAEVLVEELKLVPKEKKGRVQYFGPPTDLSVIDIVPAESSATKVSNFNSEVALLESKVRKLAAELEVTRNRLLAATLKSQM